jgi:L-aspartate oxidase
VQPLPAHEADHAAGIVNALENLEHRVEVDPAIATRARKGSGADACRRPRKRADDVLDPEEGDELAARDLVARAIWSRIRDGVPVFLDARESVGREMATRFPGVDHLCRTNGVNPATELIPVTPAAHYHMGGIAVDREGRSSIPGLWAAGEVAASGVHGANRLASNSLLEGLVFGPMAARSVVRDLESRRSTPPTSAASGGELERLDSEGAPLDTQATLPEEVVTRIRTLLWEQVGLVRHGEGMRSALEELESLETTWAPTVPAPARSLLLVARLVTHAALLREESRGSHFRSDFPEAESAPPRHSILRLARSPGHPGGLILGSLERDASRDRRSALQGSSEAIG